MGRAIAFEIYSSCRAARAMSRRKSRHRDSECRVQAAETDAEIPLSPGQSAPCPRIPRHWTVPTAGQSAASPANHGASRCFAVGPQLHEIAGKHPASSSPSLESETESDPSEHANQTRNFKCDCPGYMGVVSHGYQLELDSNRNRPGVGSGSKDASAD